MKLKNLDNGKQKKHLLTALIVILIVGAIIVVGLVVWIYFAAAEGKERGNIENASQIEVLMDVKSLMQAVQSEEHKIQFSTVAVYNEKVYYINSSNNICVFDISSEKTIIKEKIRIEKFVIFNNFIYYLNRNGEQYDLFRMSLDFSDPQKIADMLGNKENDWNFINGDIYYSKNGKGFCKYNLESGKETVITSRVVYDFQKIGAYYFIESPDQFRSFLYVVNGNGTNEKIMNNSVASFHIFDNVLYFTNNEKLFSLSFDENQIAEISDLASNAIFLVKSDLFYKDALGEIDKLELLSGKKIRTVDASEYSAFEVLGESDGKILIRLFSERRNESTIVSLNSNNTNLQESISIKGNPQIAFSNGYALVVEDEIKVYNKNLRFTVSLGI